MLSYDQDRLLHQLKVTWSKYPQLRLCQLIVNLAGNDPFYVTNERLENLLIMRRGETVAGRKAE